LIQKRQNSIQERLKKELRIRDSALQLALAHTDKKSRDAALIQLDLGITKLLIILFYFFFFLQY